MFHGFLVNNFILFFHKSLDVNLVFGKNIFEGEESFFSCVEGNFMLLELGIGRQELELIKSEGFLDLISGGFFI